MRPQARTSYLNGFFSYYYQNYVYREDFGHFQDNQMVEVPAH